MGSIMAAVESQVGSSAGPASLASPWRDSVADGLHSHRQVEECAASEVTISHSTTGHWPSSPVRGIRSHYNSWRCTSSGLPTHRIPYKKHLACGLERRTSHTAYGASRKPAGKMQNMPPRPAAAHL